MVGRRQFFAQVSLFRWHISRSMVSGRVSRQEHGIEMVHQATRQKDAHDTPSQICNHTS